MTRVQFNTMHTLVLFYFFTVSDNMFYGGYEVMKMAVWYATKMNAADQFRQRVSWALAQLLVVTLNQVSIFPVS